MYYNDFLEELTSIISEQLDISWSDASGLVDLPSVDRHVFLKKMYEMKIRPEQVALEIINQ